MDSVYMEIQTKLGGVVKIIFCSGYKINILK